MRALIASCYAALGIVLGFALDLSFKHFSPVIRQPWYESLWVPLWVACLAFVAVAVWVRFPARVSAIQGLLVTGLPYGWLLVSVYFTKGAQAFDGFAILLVCLSVAGAILNPLIVGGVSVVRPRSNAAGAPHLSKG